MVGKGGRGARGAEQRTTGSAGGTGLRFVAHDTHVVLEGHLGRLGSAPAEVQCTAFTMRSQEQLLSLNWQMFSKQQQACQDERVQTGPSAKGQGSSIMIERLRGHCSQVCDMLGEGVPPDALCAARAGRVGSSGALDTGGASGRVQPGSAFGALPSHSVLTRLASGTLLSGFLSGGFLLGWLLLGGFRGGLLGGFLGGSGRSQWFATDDPSTTHRDSGLHDVMVVMMIFSTMIQPAKAVPIVALTKHSIIDAASRRWRSSSQHRPLQWDRSLISSSAPGSRWAGC